MDDGLVLREAGDTYVEKASKEKANQETSDLEEDTGGHA
jgi:hypothetical protein